MGEMVYYLGILMGLMLVLKWGLKSVNMLIFERKLGKKSEFLPPGDFGWPFIGNMWSFLRAFNSSDPDSFIDTFVHKFGPGGIYKSLMFGKPSIIVTVPEVCRRVLSDDNAFKPGWPASTIQVVGRKSFVSVSYEEHKRLRKLTRPPINGLEALSMYMHYIETNVVSALEKWSRMGRIEFLNELQKFTFKMIMYIFLSSEIEHIITSLEKLSKTISYGIRAMGVNFPGSGYYEALKARKKLVAILETIVTEHRKKRETNQGMSGKDMLDLLLDSEDENGKKLDDEEIIDTLIGYLHAGHESVAYVIMWASVFLQAHPEFFLIAK